MCSLFLNLHAMINKILDHQSAPFVLRREKKGVCTALQVKVIQLAKVFEVKRCVGLFGQQTKRIEVSCELAGSNDVVECEHANCQHQRLESFHPVCSVNESHLALSRQEKAFQNTRDCSCDGMRKQKRPRWKRWLTGVNRSRMQHGGTSVSPDYPLSLVREGWKCRSIA